VAQAIRDAGCAEDGEAAGFPFSFPSRRCAGRAWVWKNISGKWICFCIYGLLPVLKARSHVVVVILIFQFCFVNELYTLNQICLIGGMGWTDCETDSWVPDDVVHKKSQAS